MINEAAPSKEVIAIRGLEALVQVGNGQSTKIIIPSEIQNIASLVTSVTELTKEK